MNALEIRGLTKSFGAFTLDNLTLTLPSGCIMGLVGENGAGKSTTIKLILDMLHKDSGTVTILGRDNQDNIRLTKEEVGVVLDEVGIPDCLNARQVGTVMRHTFKYWDDAEYARLVEKLSIPQNKAFKDFSRGTRMKLGIAIALSHHSKLLILDEATSGLDPVVRDEVIDMLYDFTRAEDHSILISSHIVSDLEKLCDYIAFLHKGRLMLCEEKDRLLDEYCIVRCSRDELPQFAADSVRYKKTSPYGVELIAPRDAVPSGLAQSPVSIEELFIFMVKEAD